MRIGLTGLVSCVLLAICAAPASSGPAAKGNVTDAVNLYNQGRTADALEKIREAIRADPEDIEARVWKAIIRMEQAKENRKEDSERCWRVARAEFDAIDPLYDSVDLEEAGTTVQASWYVAMAKAWWLNNRGSRADRYLKHALKLDPGNPEALQVQGEMALEQANEYASNPRPAWESADVTAQDAVRIEDAAYKIFIAEMDGAGGKSPDIRARAAWWAGVVKRERSPSRAKELFEIAIAASPGSRYAEQAKASLEAMSRKK